MTSQSCLTYGDFTVSVLIDGKEIPHHGTQTNEEKKEVSCWIASEAGKTFTVKYTKMHATSIDLKMDIYVDGVRVRSKGARQGMRVAGEVDSARISSTEIQQFIFAPLESTDDDAYLEASQRKTGDIKFEVNKTKYTVLEGPRKTPINYYSLPEPGKVHERFKKGLDHHVKLGAKSERPRSDTRLTTCAQPSTLITFVFKYRPLEILQATGIVPRHPTSLVTREREISPRRASPLLTAAKGKRKISDVKREEIEISDDSNHDDEERRLLQRLEKIRRDKLFNSEPRPSMSPNKRLKQELRTHFIPNEVIDLT